MVFGFKLYTNDYFTTAGFETSTCVIAGLTKMQNDKSK